MANQNPESVVRAFFAELGQAGGLISAVQTYMADDCRWENSGLPSAGNKQQILAMMQGFIDGYRLHALVIDVVAVAVAGDVVLTERVDHMDTADGTRLLSFPLAGTLTVRNGLIVRWSDYFDPRPLLPAS
ncbi:limonene-1,2-epoxide hydrolase family protein [Hydrocarboniphaga sp.]|uniref:limonene-1,2-epoxide hydrolase family protein n=1 Tax=Hydrocarboniphaga sp. TaxID=2033016 RepID=UPI003D116645